MFKTRMTHPCGTLLGERLQKALSQNQIQQPPPNNTLLLQELKRRRSEKNEERKMARSQGSFFQQK